MPQDLFLAALACLAVAILFFGIGAAIEDNLYRTEHHDQFRRFVLPFIAGLFLLSMIGSMFSFALGVLHFFKPF